MKEYRIRTIGLDEKGLMEVRVEMQIIKGFWYEVKSFKDVDYDFAKREAEELLDKLNEK